MDAEQNSVWQRINEFALDRPDATLTFTARLARDNGWSGWHANRVVQEYKRFMLLAATADHVVTPSEDVDQAWHLHLTYTRSYWIDFCGATLGHKIHHNPTRGLKEQSHFVDLYEQTRQTYQRVFGGAPPNDIWPDAPIRFGKDMKNRWVNLHRNWVVPKPRLPRLPSKWLAPPPGVLLGGMLAPPLLAVMNPFNFRGPQFLLFYGLIFVAALIAGFILRNTLQAEPQTESSHELSPTEIAFLSGGMERAFHAAIAEMMHAGVIESSESKKKLLGVVPLGSEQRLVATGIQPDAPDPLEQALHEATTMPLGAPIEVLRKKAAEILPEIRDGLTRRGLVGAPLGSSPARFVPMLVMLSVSVIGSIKIAVGLSRDKPVGFLALATIISVVAAIAFARRPRVTKHGKSLLSNMEGQHKQLSIDAKAPGYGFAPGELALAVALFGTPVMAGGPLDEFSRAVESFKLASGSTTTGGCGAAGCGDGGGCGGGCGGCGD